jgi:hypothetical protein
MTTIAEVRQNLSDIVDGIDGWRGSGGYVGTSVDAGMVKVFRPEFDPRVVFGGGKMQLTFQCVAYDHLAEADQSERNIDALGELTGDGSFIAAVQNSDNWDVTVDYAQVTMVGQIAAVDWGDGVKYLACPFDVEVVW